MSIFRKTNGNSLNSLYSQNKEPYVIGICGGSSSGKTTIATNICQNLNVKWASIVKMDSFYKVLSEEEQDAANRGDYDFDSPGNKKFKQPL